MASRGVIHLEERQGLSFCGRRFAHQAKLVSWESWLKLVHPLPYRLCKRCRREHARREREVLHL